MEHLAPFTKEVKVLNFGAKNDAGLRKIMREFPDEDETPDIVVDGPNRWTVDGAADLHHLQSNHL